MSISLESVLATAGIADGETVQVLRDGFPSFVVRVATSAFSGQRSVILKACPDSSREPDVLLNLHRIRLPVPAVLDVREGDGFRVIVMEDMGGDALHKHPDAEWYMAAVREIAKIHGQSGLFHLYGGPCTALTDLVPTYNDAKWMEIVREGLEGTLRRIEDGTYTGLSGRRGSMLSGILRDLAEKTLAMVGDSGVYRPFSRVLIHGDYHEGNILIRTAKDGEAVVPPPPNPYAIVDWDSARWDSGFFDLVSLYDVADRMGTFLLDPKQIIQTYLSEMLPDDLRVCGAEAEWRRCRILRAWDELRWFSTTAEDFGERAGREMGIIRQGAGPAR